MKGPREHPSVGVLLLNWERPALTIEALDSLVSARTLPERVVLVDSASRDDSVTRFVRWAAERGIPCTVSVGGSEPVPDAWLTILVAPSNRGFAIGNNLGIRHLMSHTHATHVFLLNNDASVRADAFDALGNALRTHPDAGIVTGTIFVDAGARDQPWYAGGREIPLRGLTAHVTRLPATDEVQPTEFVSGCAMVISRAALERVGLLGECYEPYYGEDAEYSRRVRLAGFPVLYDPKIVMYHKVGATVGPARLSPAVTYSQIRHRLFYIRRNFSGWQRAVALAYTSLTKPGRVVVEVLSGRPRIAWALIRGTAAGLLDPAGG